jgi:5-methylcytosine-specific restriction endonuclease McrA
MEIDHIVPESLGGLTEDDHLGLSCALCNQHKGNRIAAPDPVTGERVPLFDPRRQRWHEHIAWTTEQDRIVARTSVGRATLVALDLNRSSLVSARKAWTAVGWRPPADGTRSGQR